MAAAVLLRASHDLIEFVKTEISPENRNDDQGRGTLPPLKFLGEVSRRGEGVSRQDGGCEAAGRVVYPLITAFGGASPRGEAFSLEAKGCDAKTMPAKQTEG